MSTTGFALAVLGMIGSMAVGCGDGLGTREAKSKVHASSESNSNAMVFEDPDFQNLAFSGNLIYKPVGNHTNRYTIRSGLHDHPFGTGYALSIKEVTALGACIKYTVYDYESKKLTWVDAFGYPNCPSRTSTMPTPQTITVTDTGFRDQLAPVVEFLDSVLKDPRTTNDEKAKLKGIHYHLWSIVYPR
jgi:hypothetical protein